MLVCAAPSAAAEPVNGRIAFTTFESSADPAAGDIWTMDPDGGSKLQAVFDPLYDAQSDWAPSGDKIVFRSRRNNRFEVSIVDFTVRDGATGRPRIIDVAPATDGTQSSQPAWFPDMSGLLYRRTNAPVTTRSDIWAMNVDGTNRRPVAILPEDQFYPSFSPDMKRLLFATTAPGGGRSVQVMDIATGAVTTLFDYSPQSYDSGPAWSPDGQPDRVREQRRRRHGDLRHGRRRLERPPDHAQHGLGRGPGVVAGRHALRVLARRRRPPPRHLDHERPTARTRAS